MEKSRSCGQAHARKTSRAFCAVLIASCAHTQATGGTSRTTHLLALMKQGDGAFDARDFDTVDTIHHPDMVAYITGLPEPVYGRETHSGAMLQILCSFPDIRVNNQFGSGDSITMVTNVTEPSPAK